MFDEANKSEGPDGQVAGGVTTATEDGAVTPPDGRDAQAAPETRRARRGALVAVLALAGVLVVALVAYHALSGSVVATQGEPAVRKEGAEYLADFDATVFDEYGDARTITALADGKPLVMNFWATWCPYCVDEMADYQALYDEYGDRVSFAFIDVTDGTRETVEDASAWLRDNEYYLPAYYDTTLDAMRSYGATSLPTSVVAAADGEIVDISVGRMDPEKMSALIDSLLASEG